MSSNAVSDDEWKDVRLVLKRELLSGKIVLDSKEMRPKAVHAMFSSEFHTVDYSDKSTRDKFTRILRGLRNKHKDGDLINEDNPIKTIRWGKSAAKQYLKIAFREKRISASYSDPAQVWSEHCAGHKAFARMQCNEAFVRRLATVRDDYNKKRKRCEEDLKAYQAAIRNHPTPEFNSRGEPQWNGSNSQRRLKEMIREGSHVGKKPESLWKENADFQVYSLQTFRDHIYQEERLIKFDNYLVLLKKEKLDKLQY